MLDESDLAVSLIYAGIDDVLPLCTLFYTLLLLSSVFSGCDALFVSLFYFSVLSGIVKSNIHFPLSCFYFLSVCMRLSY